VRRLVTLTSTIVAVDAMLFTALAPLVPGYAAEFGLTKAGAGLLVSAFGAGALAGGLASGAAASRWGPKPMVVCGLCILAVASLAFAFAGDPWTLGASRFVQGIASTTTWAGALAWVTVRAPASRRGEIIGLVFGIAVAGAVAGPMFGAVARAAGIRVSFATVGAAALVMAGVAAASQAGPREEHNPGSLGRALRDPRYVGALWLNTLPATLFGVASVLVPLHLAGKGFSTLEISAVFFGAGLLEVVLNPLLGRASDRRGPRPLIRAGLAASALMAAVLSVADPAAAMVAAYVVAVLAFGSFYTPGMALGSARAARAGLTQGIAFGTMNTAWAAGQLVGPTGGGRLADAGGDRSAWLAAAALCVCTLAAAELLRVRRPAGQAA
jgi:predicted MFS family arabinose efflux permease